MSATHTTIAGIPIPRQHARPRSDRARPGRLHAAAVRPFAAGLPLGVWESIALHTTPEIPRYKQPEVRLVTLGVEYDVLGLHFDQLTPAQREPVLAAHPRTGFKEGIVEAFSAGMRDKPDTAFGTMNTDILDATLPGYVRPNFCDFIRDSRFAS
jgi:hypothetical protein